MSTYFLWPTHTLDVANIDSASTEAGLIIDVPVADSSNAGTLRLRSGGNPYEAIDLDIELVGGGNPVGYATTTNFYGAGASVIWKEQTDAADEWRGYIDSFYITRATMPFTHSGGGAFLPPGHPRELPNGELGVVYSEDGTDWNFASYDGITTATKVTTTGTVGSMGNRQSDFVILPSGRLVAVINGVNSTDSFYSDDDGATWAFLGRTIGFDNNLTFMSCEYDPRSDTIVMVRADDNGVSNAEVWVSRDGGVSFTQVSTESALSKAATCVTAEGVVLVAYCVAPNVLTVAPLVAGGGFGDGAPTTATHNNTLGTIPGIVARDDGTIWAYVMNTDATSISMSGSVSRDGGVTWEDPISTLAVWDTDFAAGWAGYEALQFGVWKGGVVAMAYSDNAASTIPNHHLLFFGGWDDITDVGSLFTGTTVGAPYEHVYMPMDLPENMGWTRTNVVAGATVTHASPGHLNIVSTAVNNSSYASNTTFWPTNTTGLTRRIRFRTRVNSGGSVADNRSRLAFAMCDLSNTQEVILRFSTTQVSILDGTGAVLSTTSVAMTKWQEFLIFMAHDSPTGAGLISVYVRGEDEDLWTAIITNTAVTELAATVRSNIRFGGSVGGAADWDVAFLGVADDDNGFSAGFTNPTDLAPRALPSGLNMRLVNGIDLGAFNGMGVPGDAYTLSTTYTYGKENLWRELRPSRHLRSSGDNVQWDVTFDAGAGHTFHSDTVTLVGTNFIDATWTLDDDPAFGSPAVNTSMNAVFATGSGGAGSAGSFVPAVNPGWRKDQLKSVSARRWFLSDSAGARFEIIGNDSDRVYVEGTPASGAWVIFGDRMGKTYTETHVRYARLRVTAQHTADDYYRVGTLIEGIRMELTKLYAENFTDRVEPKVTIHESDNGYRSASRQGPRRTTLSFQWTPMSRYCTDFALALEDWYNAVQGSLTPFIFWRDSDDEQTIQLVRCMGIYARPNERGELDTALASIDQLVLEEEL